MLPVDGVDTPLVVGGVVASAVVVSTGDTGVVVASGNIIIIKVTISKECFFILHDYAIVLNNNIIDMFYLIYCDR